MATQSILDKSKFQAGVEDLADLSSGRVSTSGWGAINNALDDAITTARNQATSAVNSAKTYGNAAIDASNSGVDTAKTYGDNAIDRSSAAVDYAKDYGNRAIDSAQSGVDAATSYGDNAISSGQSGVDAILSGRGVVDSAYNNMIAQAEAANRGYDDAEDAARGMDPYIRGVGDAATAMLPYADKLGGYGDQMWESGTKVTEQALATLGTGMGFINMDAGASPLVAEALSIYGQIDPNRYVASAAQDVQKAADNAQGQMNRNLARQGVNPSSGAAQAQLQKLFQNSLAVAKAAAMTRARERGINDKATALQNLIANNANTFLQTGGQLASIGASGQGAAVNAQNAAAGVLQNSGQLQGTAATLQGNKAGVLGNVAAGRNTVATTYGNASNLVTGYNKDLASAYNVLAGLYNTAGSNVASAYSTLAGVTNTAGSNIAGAQQSLANTTQNAGNAITSAYNNLAGTTQSAGNAITSAQLQQANITNSTENTRVSAMTRGGSAVSTNTGRHYGVGGELLETGNAAVDAQLQAWRDSNK